MQIESLRQQLRSLDARPCHEQRVLTQWLRAESLAGGPRKAEDFLPLKLRASLTRLQQALSAIATLRSEHPATDGSSRLLIALADGQTVESVLLPRGGLCVSSQVGCAVGCVFCMTGRDGLLRQLTSAEIVAQLVIARQQRPVNKVVFMGMGEPSHNLDAVMESIELLGTAGGIGHKNLVFSTVGDMRVFERLANSRVKPALAISLHATSAELRARLLPRAARIEPIALVDAAERYARATHHPIQYQWTLLAGINDIDAELDGIVQLLAGKSAVMNLIAYNAVDGLDFMRPSEARSQAIAQSLQARGILTKLRQSAAQDVLGGCGQLRARAASWARPQIEIKAMA